MWKLIKIVFYFSFANAFILMGLVKGDAIMCGVAALFVVAGEIAAKDGGKDNG